MKRVRETLETLGFEILHQGRTKTTQGPDMWVRKPNGRPLSVEIKVPRRKKKGGSWMVDPVSPPRRKDDLIAIAVSDRYVMVEPMEDHLRCCSPSGARPLTLLLGENP